MTGATEYSSSRSDHPQCRGPRVTVHPHAVTQAWKRQSPVKFAVKAVTRQLSQLRRVCTTPGDRAAIDYREGIAVVERLADGQIEIRTILEKWMFVDNLPVVPDYVKSDTAPGKPHGQPEQRYVKWSIAGLLSAGDRAKLRAAAR